MRKQAPWQQAKARQAALRNQDVRFGYRTLPDGHQLRGMYANRDFDVGELIASYSGRLVSCTEREALGPGVPETALMNEYGVMTIGDTGCCLMLMKAVRSHP